MSCTTAVVARTIEGLEIEFFIVFILPLLIVFVLPLTILQLVAVRYIATACVAEGDHLSSHLSVRFEAIPVLHDLVLQVKILLSQLDHILSLLLNLCILGTQQLLYLSYFESRYFILAFLLVG